MISQVLSLIVYCTRFFVPSWVVLDTPDLVVCHMFRQAVQHGATALLVTSSIGVGAALSVYVGNTADAQAFVAKENLINDCALKKIKILQEASKTTLDPERAIAMTNEHLVRLSDHMHNPKRAHGIVKNIMGTGIFEGLRDSGPSQS
jgi:hypothetical protein